MRLWCVCVCECVCSIRLFLPGYHLHLLPLNCERCMSLTQPFLVAVEKEPMTVDNSASLLQSSKAPPRLILTSAPSTPTLKYAHARPPLSYFTVVCTAYLPILAFFGGCYDSPFI